MRKLIVGLGNPEEERQRTRHNIGWRAIDTATKGLEPIEKDYGLVYTRGDIVYLKPTVGMNSSGNAVKACIEEYKISGPEALLIIVDDLDLSFGEIRARGKGGARHNGLRSIEEFLETKAYPRVKVGIGKNFEEGGQFDYVLGDFTKEEEKQIPEILEKVKAMIEVFCSGDIVEVMNKFNGK